VPIETFEQHTPRIHPSAFVHPSAHLIGDVQLDDESSVWPTAVLRGDHGAILIGPRTSIQDGSVAHSTHGTSETRIGAECTVGHRAILHGCRVGDRCLVGMGSILLDNSEIGDDSFVAAGALVPPNRKYPPRSFILGSPARRMREVTLQEVEWIRYSCEAYRDLARRHRRAPSPT
jgi:gamma-carbonic anhydrase